MTDVWDDFDTVAAVVSGAATAEDLFGPAGPGADPGAARAEYRRLARSCHPDRHGGARTALAGSTFAALTRRWREWQAAHAGRPTSAAQTLLGDYLVGDLVGRTEVADLHAGRRVGDPGDRALVKVVRRPADRDLLAVEARVLGHLAAAVDRRWLPYLPVLRGGFRHVDAEGNRRRYNVFDRLDGFVSVATVAAAFPGGIDPRDAAWMWRRLLVALGAVHRSGVVHGAVLPDHVLIHPGDHGLVLTDWCYAADVGQPLVAMVARHRDWYPPEVAARQPAGPATDIALATRTLSELMGDRAPAALRRFAAGCTLPRPASRPDDAWRLLAELDDLLEAIYGPRRFRPFHLPPTIHRT